ncbi:chymotrypsin-1-like [Pararge aegeria]|uniref:chymotrypsin-1-like n=1 Tax=Pararge aegeria TaxID=116150 RepID=UPI0019D1987C|nr:chymotrypsin-1-like [Pararge aegeria]
MASKHSSSAAAGARYAFFRSMGDAGAARRVFGGAAVAAGAAGAHVAVALRDARGTVRCSGCVLRAHWALTAAHCVSARLASVQYGSTAGAGGVTAIQLLYRHPHYAVEQRDDGWGPDVTALRHDVGLVRTRNAMRLPGAPFNLRVFRPETLYDEEVEVLGFGRTERSVLGEELRAVRLRLTACERASWRHCVCGAADELRGVCSGDSGGPVMYRGALIGVTSMGPTQCAQAGAAPPAAATSVFTALYPYADLIDATIRDTDSGRVSAAACARRCDALTTLWPIICVLSNFATVNH